MKKTRYTEIQMLTAFNEWKHSGLSKTDYCRKSKLPRSAFFYWIKKLSANENPSANIFKEIKIPQQKAAPCLQVPAMEIEFPSGAKLKLYQMADVSWIKAIV